MAIGSEIPTEILSEIFYLLCKRSIFVCELNNSCCKHDFPWAVGMVCQRWRTVFVSYPPIWASLTLSEHDHDSCRIANPGIRNESHANEVNRRLALYLERSAMYPLNLEVFLSTDRNVSTTTMALKMLSASSERWRTIKFYLPCEWQVDCLLPCKGKWPVLEWLEIRGFPVHEHTRNVFEVAPKLAHAYVKPWATNYGWILPWTQLTEVGLVLDGGSDVPNLLAMLHSIKKLRIRFNDHLNSEDNYPRLGPILLNQLRILEVQVPHPDILSWFEAPSLCDLYFVDYQDYDDEPLDFREQLSSLIQRSSCKIRKLVLESGRKFYSGTLNDVEELEIDHRDTTSEIRYPPVDISSLPNLRCLTIICNLDEDIEILPNALTVTLKSARVPARNERSTDAPISKLERLAIKLFYYDEQPKIPKSLQKIADKWPLVVFLTERSYRTPYSWS